jgi:hypothetical protein
LQALESALATSSVGPLPKREGEHVGTLYGLATPGAQMVGGALAMLAVPDSSYSMPSPGFGPRTVYLAVKLDNRRAFLIAGPESIGIIAVRDR